MSETSLLVPNVPAPLPPQLLEVAFKGNRKEFFLWDALEPPPTGIAVIVDADRGEDLGHVHATGERAQHRFDGVPHGMAAGGLPGRHVLRLATAADVRRERDLREREDGDARMRASERVRANSLVMKLTDAEWQWDRKKLTFYFTAEKRVDFRTLVRDLAAMFRTRIELKQIGVREEARRLDGIGRCGRQYCSASWLPELRPVNLGVAKDQRLSLNPSQISGACGRLMCCLRYEHEFYVQSRKRFPKEGRILATALGEEKVVSADIFRERVTLRNAEGDMRVVALADLTAELSSAAAQRPLGADVPGTRADMESDGLTSASPQPRGERAVGDRDAAGVDRRDLRMDDALDHGVENGVDTDVGSSAGDDVSAEAAALAEGSAEDGGESERRARRRRGRRGGRRGRGTGGAEPESPPTGGQ